MVRPPAFREIIREQLLTLVKLYISPHPDPSTGCWIWLGPRQRNGYGYLDIAGHRIYAHRLVYWLFNPTTPISGLELDHKCRNRICVNPTQAGVGKIHLEPVTREENQRRMHEYWKLQGVEIKREKVVSSARSPKRRIARWRRSS